jgi:TatD DNase family protein
MAEWPVPLWTDSHCHYHLESPQSLLHRPAFPFFLMSTQQSEWHSVADYCKDLDDAIPCFGVHPWNASTVGDAHALEMDLIGRLQTQPHAIVGECGLDFSVIPPNAVEDIEQVKLHQLSVFQAHLRAACETNRPLSIHCVKAFHALECAITTQLSRATVPHLHIALHSFGGSAEFAQQLLRLERHVSAKFFFGLSDCINRRSAARTGRLVKAIPVDRILLESDLKEAESAQEALNQIASLVSAHIELEPCQVLLQHEANTQAFYRSVRTIKAG